MATIRAARKGLQSVLGQKQPEHYEAERPDERAVTIHRLLERMKRLGPAAEGWEAGVYAALDRAPDLRKALDLADRVYLAMKAAKSRDQQPERFNRDDEREEYADRQELLEKIAEAAAKTHTDPSDPQVEAGNYREGEGWVQGLRRHSEQPKTD